MREQLELLMRLLTPSSSQQHFVRLSLCALVLGLLSIIPVRLAIAYHQAPKPQAILTLGGERTREVFTAYFAQAYPELDIWISSGIPPAEARQIFRSADVSDQRVNIDQRAADTVTNFTSLVEDFKAQDIQHVYLITSDFHMPRAQAIAAIVLGSRGITFTPVVVPSRQSPESLPHIARDIGRSVLWLATGRTGASLNPHLHVRRQA